MTADPRDAAPEICLETGWVSLDDFPAKIRLMASLVPEGEVVISCSPETALGLALAVEDRGKVKAQSAALHTRAAFLAEATEDIRRGRASLQRGWIFYVAAFALTYLALLFTGLS